MKWLVTQASGKKISIEMPERVVDLQPTAAHVDGHLFTMIWSRTQETLFLRDAAGKETVLRVRRADIERFAGESQSQIDLEFAGAGIVGASTFKAQIEIDVPANANRNAGKAASGATIRSPMAGKILAVMIAEGKSVQKGDLILVVEAMKMENKIFASTSGTIDHLRAEVGALVVVGQELLHII